MKQLLTTGIILRRTDYGEADRIITLLTPDYGKLSLLAKGVRRIKSKLAGGIELFSVSNITFIAGRGNTGLGTLVSTRLITHYGRIVQDISRTMLGYELIKNLNTITEDNPESEYFDLLRDAFAALDDPAIPLDLINLWFDAQLLRLGGHSPNLRTDTSGTKLAAEASYDFDFDAMAFTARPDGNHKVDDIKFLRLTFSGNSPQVLQKVNGSADLAGTCLPLTRIMASQFLRR